MYKLVPNRFGGDPVMVQRLSDTAYIPFSADNTDYQEYLKWLAAGNTPLPPDAPAQQEGAAQ